MNGRWSVTVDAKGRVLLVVKTGAGDLIATLSPNDAESIGQAMVRHASAGRVLRNEPNVPDQPWDYLPGGGMVTYPRRDDDYGQGAMDAVDELDESAWGQDHERKGGK